MNVRRRWLLAGAIVVAGACMSLAIACSSDSNDNNKNTPQATKMNETPSETMADETPNETEMAGETPGETMAPGEVHISATEYKLAGVEGAAIDSAPAGHITFEVHNDGTIQHSFYVVKTDLDQASLPLDGTKVDENATGVDFVDEIDDFDAGTIKTLSVDLEAGHYVLICNIAGHYTQGMHAAFDVM
jgi:uncharacterized cupredoxin-like copper-binding protein